MSQVPEVWGKDKLNRKNEADYIKKYLNNLYAEESIDKDKESFVLNLNSPWGYGKSFFLNALKIELEKDKHPVIFFDAWENDYSRNPLLAFISELEANLKKYTSEIPKGKAVFDKTKKTGRKLLGVVAGIGANIATKALIGQSLEELKEKLDIAVESSDAISETIGKRAEKAAEEWVKKSLDEHQDIKNLILEFKKNLGSVTKELEREAGYKLPMYVLIDELDRCRPSYAIELLESIKHVFNVPGVYFILATNKSELCHSISAIYGNSFDGFNYLKRFFNQEYNLVISDTEEFVKHLFIKHKIDETKLFCPFDSKINKTDNINHLLFKKLSEAFGIGLRDMEQIVIQLRSITLTSNTQVIHLPYMLYILISLHMNLKQDENAIGHFQNFYLATQYRTDSFNWEPRDIDMETVLTTYLALSKMTVQKIHEKSSRKGMVYEELIIDRLVRKDHLEHNLKDYYLLAHKAGHLS